MHNIVFDFETYYDKDITLSKLSYSEYIPQAKPYLLSVCINGSPTVIKTFERIEKYLHIFPWDDINFIAHNTIFDAAVLLHWFRHKAARYSCTLSAARHRYPTYNNSLDALQQRLLPNHPQKNKAALQLSKGKTWEQLTPTEQQTLIQYSKNDAKLCSELYETLYPQLPQQEQNIIDHTIKLWLNPTLEFDNSLAEQAIAHNLDQQTKQLATLKVEKTTLTSNTKFATYLDQLGYEVPVKWSEKQQKEIPALAKNDIEFKDFYENNPELQPLLDAKLSNTSNINRTRLERLNRITAPSGLLPICYNYHGAQTGRFSGGNKCNLQNLPRGSALRNCIIAPEHTSIIVADLAQIEARLLAWFVGQNDLLNIFKIGGDPYLELAKKIYNNPDLTKKENPTERMVGKCATLGLGYGMGANKFKTYTKIQGVELDTPFCELVVKTYRTANNKITACWRTIEKHIHYLLPNSSLYFDGCALPKEVRTPFGTPTNANTPLLPLETKGFSMEAGRINLPSGRPLYYENMRYEHDQWIFGHHNKTYGAKLVENIIQALARDVLVEAMLDIHKTYPIVMHTHDEVITVVPDSQTETATDFIRARMTTPPTWAPSLPLGVDIGVAKRYGDAK